MPLFLPDNWMLSMTAMNRKGELDPLQVLPLFLLNAGPVSLCR